MGQYWKAVNLTKKEYINPHKLGCGLKLWEQLANHPGTGAALIILTAAMPEPRGGGDFDLEENWHGPERTFPEYGAKPSPMPESYPEIAQRTIGRWTGDRIALIGDYAGRHDLSPEDDADLIYALCIWDEDERRRQVTLLENEGKKDEAKRLAGAQLYRDITDDVCAVIEHELRGKFVGEGWREFEYDSP